ncbi:hypothetical protein GGR52DRAFT_563842 [Hypoxylon sp. FL1284]|nr:hypothetical protein GGR52DRAFT_563842 [Hypoxylon sp. FL1284]
MNGTMKSAGSPSKKQRLRNTESNNSSDKGPEQIRNGTRDDKTGDNETDDKPGDESGEETIHNESHGCETRNSSQDDEAVNEPQNGGTETPAANINPKISEWTLWETSSFDTRYALRTAASNNSIMFLDKISEMHVKIKKIELFGSPAWKEVGAASGSVLEVPREELKVLDECIKCVVPNFAALRDMDTLKKIDELRLELPGHTFLTWFGTLVEKHIGTLCDKCTNAIPRNARLERVKRRETVRQRQIGGIKTRGSRLRFVTNADDIADVTTDQTNGQSSTGEAHPDWTDMQTGDWNVDWNEIGTGWITGNPDIVGGDVVDWDPTSENTSIHEVEHPSEPASQEGINDFFELPEAQDWIDLFQHFEEP